MTLRVKWIGEDSFAGQAENGASVIMCADENNKESIQGVSPLQMLLLGVGGCASVDVVMILKKARQDIVDCVCEIDYKRRDEMPRIYTHIHLTFKISGRNVAEKHVERAIALSAEKYCSAAAMLEKAAEITHSFEITEL
jgi:putative redox protein